ncbi:MAG: hypothetical protein ACRD4D_00685 [Candidatus Acidiferrales bacterium]
MNCSLCEHELTPLTAFLAGTRVGTQCPACGARLRNLSKTLSEVEGRQPPLAFGTRAEAELAAPLRKRAA